LNPVVDHLRSMVSSTMEPKSQPPADLGILGQDDFRTLMSASQQAPRLQGVQPAPNPEKYQVVTAMASGGMADLDIARHLGMTRDEVRMVLTLSQKSG